MTFLDERGTCSRVGGRDNHVTFVREVGIKTGRCVRERFVREVHVSRCFNEKLI